MKTVAVLEGWAGGPKLSTQFTKQLQEHNLQPTKSTKNADIIVAHSTGCYMIPKNINASLIMFIDPPYWPGHSIIRRWINMGNNELKMLIKLLGYKKFIRDKLWEIYYIFAKPGYTYSVFRNHSHLEFLEQLTNKRALLIRNTNDEFCSPQIKNIVQKHANIKFFEIDGYHGDYYLHPKPYIDLLLKELK